MQVSNYVLRAAKVLIVCVGITRSIGEASAAETEKKFGTFFTPTGDIVELFYDGATDLKGKVIKLGPAANTTAITVLGENRKEGEIKLNFYKDNNFIKAVTYDRTAQVKRTTIGKQVYTDWKATSFDSTNVILSQYGLNSLNSLIIGTGKPSGAHNHDWKTDTHIDFNTYSRAQQRLDAFFEKTIGTAAKPANKIADNQSNYTAIRVTRPTAAYFSAAGIKQNISLGDLHVRTFGTDSAIVYMKPSDLKKVAVAFPTSASFKQEIDVLPPPLTIQVLGIKIPNPNFIETYVKKFVLDANDIARLSRIYQDMGVRFCDTTPPSEGVMLIYCDYFRDIFARDGNPEWYRTAIVIAVTSPNENAYTVASMIPRTAVANNVKNDYENAKRKFGSPKNDVTDAESFLLQAFIKALAHEYPGTHR